MAGTATGWSRTTADGVPRPHDGGLDQLHRHGGHPRRHERPGRRWESSSRSSSAATAASSSPAHRRLEDGQWVSAAVPGSGMNSLQMTDLAGTNLVTSRRQVLSTSLYFGTQDNFLWASPDGGRTWPLGRWRRGLRPGGAARRAARRTHHRGYVEIGGNWAEQFSDANFRQPAPRPGRRSERAAARFPADEAGVLSRANGGRDEDQLAAPPHRRRRRTKSTFR